MAVRLHLAGEMRACCHLDGIRVQEIYACGYVFRIVLPLLLLRYIVVEPMHTCIVHLTIESAIVCAPMSQRENAPMAPGIIDYYLGMSPRRDSCIKGA
jgi:hypothetical protein